jgi:hypothetical protein
LVLPPSGADGEQVDAIVGGEFEVEGEAHGAAGESVGDVRGRVVAAVVAPDFVDG